MEEERAYIEWLKGQKSKETKPAEEMVGLLSLMCRIALSTDSYQWFGLQTRQSISILLIALTWDHKLPSEY